MGKVLQYHNGLRVGFALSLWKPQLYHLPQSFYVGQCCRRS
jgi:hypothetical protein